MIIERIRSIGKCVTGKTHVKNGTVCQDKIFNIDKNGVHVITLCDGAGSCANSHIGAEITSRVVGEFFANSYNEVLIMLEDPNGIELLRKSVIKIVIDALNKYVTSNHEINLNDLSCTLLFVVTFDNKYIAGHIGDGVIGVLKSNLLTENIHVLSCPENGGAPNITYFVTDKDAVSRLRIYTGELSSIKGFILMSDGPEEALYGNGQLSDNCKLLFEALNGSLDNEYNEFLKNVLSTKIASISYDDLSINILFRESIDTSETDNEELYAEILDNLSDNQIIKLSDYAVLIDKSIGKVGLTKNLEERLTELKRRYDK